MQFLQYFRDLNQNIGVFLISSFNQIFKFLDCQMLNLVHTKPKYPRLEHAMKKVILIFFFFTRVDAIAAMLFTFDAFSVH